MQRIALGVEYDGSGFAGWQVQRGRRTVAAELGSAVARVADQPVDLICGGRTDAGVHAWGQVVHFDAPVTRSLRGWLLGINSNLPDDISVRWARPVPDWFHARYSALARTYRYCILNRDTRCALRHGRRATWVRRPLEVAAMQAAADRLVGEHDFSAFRSAECQSRSPVRRVERIESARWDQVLDRGRGERLPAPHGPQPRGPADPRRHRGRAPAGRRGAGAATAAARPWRRPGRAVPAGPVRYPAAFRLPAAEVPASGEVEQGRRSAMIRAH
jgi:tRNA pseudouridine(38-40) synthase